MGKLRKRDLKGTQKDKGDPTANESPKEGDVDGDFTHNPSNHLFYSLSV